MERRCEKVGGSSKHSSLYPYMKLLKKKDSIKKIIDNNQINCEKLNIEIVSAESFRADTLKICLISEYTMYLLISRDFYIQREERYQ